MEKKKIVVKATEEKLPLFQQLAIKTIQLAQLAEKKKGIKAVMLLILAVFAYHATHMAHAMTAALYIFANDGKISGRMQGDVKMRNGRQRAFTVPALVRNTYTSGVRSRFQEISSSYKGLAPGDVASWVNAVGFTYIDRFAVPHVLKGKALYVRLNMNLTNIGVLPITTAPIATGVIATIINDVGISVGTTSATLSFTPTPIPTGVKVLLFATTSLNGGITRPSNSAFRQIAVLPSATASGVDVYTDYIAKFGTPVVNAQIFFRAISISMATGEASAISQFNTIVGA